jgi:hypothetical protein
MQDNIQQSPIIRFFKKIWPATQRIINNILYFIVGIIKSIFKGAADQFKGGFK